MTTSTNGQICYGIVFDEGHEFPWDAEHEGDIDDWWLYGVHKFKHSFELYDEAGDNLNGVEPSREEVSRYFDESRAFTADHPLPVALVDYCSNECSMYILAVPRTIMFARRGYPATFEPSALTVTDEEREALLAFCADHFIEVPADPQWLLSSYWG
jgi:hypothetical protein